jgi:hypothetical protein
MINGRYGIVKWAANCFYAFEAKERELFEAYFFRVARWEVI